MFILFVFFAAVVEAINELTFGRVFGEGKPFPKLSWVLPFSALGFALALSFAVKATLLTWAAATIAGAELELTSPVVDYVISGILISGGSRYLHQFLSNFAPGN